MCALSNPPKGDQEVSAVLAIEDGELADGHRDTSKGLLSG